MSAGRVFSRVVRQQHTQLLVNVPREVARGLSLRAGDYVAFSEAVDGRVSMWKFGDGSRITCVVDVGDRLPINGRSENGR